jgi:Ca2+-binding EF-hand superfamily protein
MKKRPDVSPYRAGQTQDASESVLQSFNKGTFAKNPNFQQGMQNAIKNMSQGRQPSPISQQKAQPDPYREQPRNQYDNYDPQDITPSRDRINQIQKNAVQHLVFPQSSGRGDITNPRIAVINQSQTLGSQRSVESPQSDFRRSTTNRFQKQEDPNFRQDNRPIQRTISTDFDGTSPPKRTVTYNMGDDNMYDRGRATSPMFKNGNQSGMRNTNEEPGTDLWGKVRKSFSPSKSYASQKSEYRSNSPQQNNLKSPFEKRFSAEEIQFLRDKYRNFAQDTKSNRLGFLSIFGLGEFEDTRIGQRIYNSMKYISATNSATLVNSIDYEKYIKLVAILTRGDSNERIKLLFGIFDANGEGRVTKKDLFMMLSFLLKLFRSTRFEMQGPNSLRDKVNSIDEEELEQIVEDIAGDVFASYSRSGSFLTEDEWREWFSSQFGMLDILNFKCKPNLY